MAEWLGKSRIEEEDIKKSIPSLVEFFPMLTKYYVDDQKMRIVLPLPYDEGERFKQAVIKAYGSFTPLNVRRAAAEAIEKWVKAHK